MPVRFIPEPYYERETRQLVKYYKKAFKEIAGQLRGIQNGIERQHALSLLNQIEYILRLLDADSRSWAEQAISDAFTSGQAGAIYALGEASSLKEAAAIASFSMLARDTVESLINDTYTDLLMATQNTDRKVKQLVQKVVSDTMRVRAVEQLGRRTIRNEIVESLAAKGLSRTLQTEAWVGIVDKAGRRWNLSTYAETVTRTKLQQAHIEGVRVESLERGVDLAVVSSHGAKDACRVYEGMVISMNGLTKGYKTYAELRSTGKIFHPNCKHHISPLRNLDLLSEKLRVKNEEAYRKLGLEPPVVK